MKPGNIRRIDSNGRVYIPRDMRRVLNLPEGSPMELQVDNGTLVLKKYVPEEKLSVALDMFEERLEFESSDLDYYDVKEIGCLIGEIRDILCKEG